VALMLEGNRECPARVRVRVRVRDRVRVGVTAREQS
jgi:hypothetical protein